MRCTRAIANFPEVNHERPPIWTLRCLTDHGDADRRVSGCRCTDVRRQHRRPAGVTGCQSNRGSERSDGDRYARRRGEDWLAAYRRNRHGGWHDPAAGSGPGLVGGVCSDGDRRDGDGRHRRVRRRGRCGDGRRVYAWVKRDRAAQSLLPRHAQGVLHAHRG